jgi:hypothetical protein
MRGVKRNDGGGHGALRFAPCIVLVFRFPGANGFCGYEVEGERETREISETREKAGNFSRVSLISRVSRSLLDIGPKNNNKNR